MQTTKRQQRESKKTENLGADSRDTDEPTKTEEKHRC